MAEDPLLGLGAPLPLGPELRARLEGALLAGDVPLLEGLDAPLALSPALRASLESHVLTRRPARRRHLLAFAVSAGVAAAALVIGLVLLPRPAPRPAPSSPRTAQSAALPSWQVALTSTSPPRSRNPLASLSTTARAAASPAAAGGVTSVEQLPMQNLTKSLSDALILTQSLAAAPSSAPIGTWVELRGADVGSARRVLFGTTPASAVHRLSDTVLEVLVPAGIGTVDVRTDTGRVGRFTYP